MAITKGYTVHLAQGNSSACGVKPRLFMGRHASTIDVRRITCKACERIARQMSFVVDQGSR